MSSFSVRWVTQASSSAAGSSGSHPFPHTMPGLDFTPQVGSTPGAATVNLNVGTGESPEDFDFLDKLDLPSPDLAMAQFAFPSRGHTHQTALPSTSQPCFAFSDPFPYLDPRDKPPRVTISLGTLTSAPKAATNKQSFNLQAMKPSMGRSLSMSSAGPDVLNNLKQTASALGAANSSQQSDTGSPSQDGQPLACRTRRRSTPTQLTAPARSDPLSASKRLRRMSAPLSSPEQEAQAEIAANPHWTKSQKLDAEKRAKNRSAARRTRQRKSEKEESLEARCNHERTQQHTLQHQLNLATSQYERMESSNAALRGMLAHVRAGPDLAAALPDLEPSHPDAIMCAALEQALQAPAALAQGDAFGPDDPFDIPDIGFPDLGDDAMMEHMAQLITSEPHGAAGEAAAPDDCNAAILDADGVHQIRTEAPNFEIPGLPGSDGNTVTVHLKHVIASTPADHLLSEGDAKVLAALALEANQGDPGKAIMQLFDLAKANKIE